MENNIFNILNNAKYVYISKNNFYILNVIYTCVSIQNF